MKTEDPSEGPVEVGSAFSSASKDLPFLSSSPHPLIPSSPYPLTPAERDRWILARRSPRNRLDPGRPYAFLAEQEAGPDGVPVDVATLFLTNRECPFRCLMCDLWQNTLEETVPPGAIPAQIRHALGQLPPPDGRPRHLKLYNAGSFFDPRAIPPADYPEIARLCAPFERVIVECHPAFVGERLHRFQTLLQAQQPAPGLEVALGLETAHPEVLARLNKRMTLAQFRHAAARLREAGVALRVFLLVRPPWLSEAEGLEWAKRSLKFAFDCGASACALIPTRAGNGAMEALAASGEWAPPTLSTLEAALEYGLALRAGRVFVDLWDVERVAHCPHCAVPRIARLGQLNLTQKVAPVVDCRSCNREIGP
jgi:radical SAM enzyme (TIGR01210 family)